MEDDYRTEKVDTASFMVNRSKLLIWLSLWDMEPPFKIVFVSFILTYNTFFWTISVNEISKNLITGSEWVLYFANIVDDLVSTAKFNQ